MNYNLAQREEMSRKMGTMYMALDAVTKFVANWLDTNLKTLDSNYWNRYVITALFPAQQETVRANGAKTVFDLDQPTILSVFLQNKSVLVRELGVDPQLFGYAHSIKDIRNKYFHKNSKPLPQKRFRHDVETVVLFLEGLGADRDIIDRVKGNLDQEESERAEVPQSDRRITIKVSPDAGSRKMSGANSSEIRMRGTENSVPITAPAVVKQTNMASGSCDTKRYPQTVQDRLNARQITGFHVETVYGAEAKGLYDACNASSAGYDLVAIQFAIVAKRSADSAFSLKDVKSKLDRGFVGLIPDFRNAIISQSHGALIWFFGSNEQEGAGSVQEPITIVDPPASAPMTIPQWFQKEIHSDALPYLSADEVQTTMELSERDVERYAKTYAPRSFTEGVTAGRNLPSEFRMAAGESGHISMLDVGCGTAAFSLGVIHGLDRVIDKVCEPKLDLVDGNLAMITKARAFFLSRETARTYGVQMVRTEWFEREIIKVSDCFPKATYDLIVTSKFLGELVCRGMKDVYSAFFKDAIQHLNPGGQMVLVDVPKHREQIEQAIKIVEKKVCNVVARDITVQPRFVGSESTDSEIVMLVQVSK